MVRFAGKTFKLNLNKRGEPDFIIWREVNAKGNKTYKIGGANEKVTAKQKEIARKYPGLKWEDFDIKKLEPPEFWIEFDLNLAAPHLRRLAAKVAFERFSQLRGCKFVADKEFNVIREFIRTGEERQASCSVLADLRLLKKSLYFRPPLHAVVIIAHPLDRVLGAFVSFFGLFYYWVILSNSYTALGPMDNLLLEHPSRANQQFQYSVRESAAFAFRGANY